MHRLTCNEADRLAADLERASEHLQMLAGQQQRYADGLTVVDEWRPAQYHALISEQARAEAKQLGDYAQRLRARSALWPAARQPQQGRARTPATMRPKPTRRARRQAA